ncbi:MAG: fructose-1,6-bisphosphatase, partial [Planctomycetes bacterium]|nr:fructose-1,6-bisphosphatase [Planctomycetota bacterium]
VISNDTVNQVFENVPMVSGIASEEMEDVHLLHGTGDGKYVISVDPLDGSGNVDVAGQMGTIFGIYRRISTSGPPTLADFLQPGKNLVAAGYILYGPCTMMVYSSGGPVNGFTLDRSIGTFFCTHPDLKIPEGSGAYSVNEANEAKWDDKTQAMVRAFRMQQTDCGKRSARYAGALVGDFHRTLLKGGIYMYPGEMKKPEGKLRLLYENAPLAFLCENAGGAASDGKQRILDIQPEKLHQRTPLYLGSKGDVEEAVRRLS